MLDTGSGTGLGLTLAEARAVIRWALFVAGAAAAATAVLGFFVLRRDRTARVALTVATVPLVLCAPFAGGFLAAVVAASTAMLWTRPARDWFAGRPVRPSPAFLDTSRRSRDTAQPRDQESRRPPAFVAPPVSRPSQEDAPHAGEASRPETGHDDGPQPTQGYGEAPGGPTAPAPYSPGPVPFGVAHAAPPGSLADRPRAVQTACVVAAVFTGIALLAGLLLAGLLAFSPDSLVDQITGMREWQDAGLDKELLVPALWTWAVVLVFWCSGALVLVWFTWRRSNSARIALITSAVMAGVIGVLGFPVSLPHLIACAAVIGLLVSAPARAWFAPPQRGGRPGPW